MARGNGTGIKGLALLGMLLVAAQAMAARVVLDHEAQTRSAELQVQSTATAIKVSWRASELELGVDGKLSFEAPRAHELVANEGNLPAYGGLVRLPSGVKGQLRLLSGTVHRIDEASGTRTETRQLAGEQLAAHVQLGEAVVWRDVVAAPLRVQPARRDADGALWAATDLQFAVEPGASGGPAIEQTQRPVSRAFWPLYQATLLNGLDELGVRLADRRGSYLIIISDSYAGGEQLFANFKRREGYNVVIDTFTSSLSLQELQATVSNAWETFDPPLEYVLLIGDTESGSVGDIPCARISNPLYPQENDATDWPLTHLEGDDYFPEIMIGRIPVTSQTDAYKATRRIVDYRTNSSGLPLDDPHWRRAALVAANYSEGGGRPLTPVATTQYIEDKMRDDWGVWNPQPLYWRQGLEQTNATDIITAINQGALFTTYRGWGNASEWVKPEFSLGDIDDINNQGRLTLLTSFVCNTGDFANIYNQPMFAEKWLTAGTPSTPTGAVTVVAPSDLHTNTRYNNSLLAGFYYGVYVDNLPNVSQALLRAKYELFLGFPSEQSSGQPVPFYYHVYHVLGDPSLDMWRRPPRLMEALVSSPTVAQGQGHIEVSVARDDNGYPLPGAHVQAMQDGVQLGGGFTNDAGVALLSLEDAAEGTVDLIVHHPDYLPAQQNVTVAQQASFVGVEGWQLSAGANGVMDLNETVSLTVTFTNSGSEAQSGLSGTLSHASPDLLSISNSTVTIGDLVAGASATADPFEFALARPLPDGAVVELNLLIENGSGDSWPAKAWLTSGAIHMEVEGFQVTGSSPYEPGQSTSLTVTLNNLGSSTLAGGTAQLSSWDEAVTVTSATATPPDIGPGESGSVGPFDVTVAGDTYRGRPVTLQLLFLEGNDTLDVVNFTAPVAGAQPSDPLGPDAHGYFVYDNSDLEHAEAPSYAWPDLASVGAATLVEMTDDALTRVALPFDFSFYGESYAAGDSITISSNGWLSFFEEDYDYANNFFRNWHIPSSLGPRGLVAPFWDDIKPTFPVDGAQESIELRYHYDAGEGVLALEWTNSVNRYAWNDTLNYPAEFAVLLYDPAQHSTPTGDGVIEFHYRDVVNVDEVNNFATVGIERPDKQRGLEYSYAGLYPASAAALEAGRALRFTTTAPDGYAEQGDGAALLPRELTLHNVHPNPFNASATIRFELAQRRQVRLELFNLLGQRVATLVDRELAAGVQQVRFQADEYPISSGLLMLRLEAGGEIRWGKMMYLK